MKLKQLDIQMRKGMNLNPNLIPTQKLKRIQDINVRAKGINSEETVTNL